MGLARRCWQWLQRHIHHHHRIISSTKITCKIPNQLRSRPLRFKGHAFVMTDDILPSLEDQGVHQLYPKGPNIDVLSRKEKSVRGETIIVREESGRYISYLQELASSSQLIASHQARATLIHILELQIQRRKQAVEDIKRRREEARDFSRSLLERWRTPTHLLC
ncbi:Mediator complex, subunit Med7 [Prunus dulcis]|uniref:Mediator complex, subunit Med7 n=1 Tax=Prunus dulcis TaxID=3755 RepID=A0A5H2XT63_PRUDU|nr:Mediator complex, subunit Med7 [Prunus dulcis]